MLPERFFLDRFALSPSLLDRVLGTALRGRVDDADIYLEYRVNEELLLEEGAVKKASRHVSQGAGVRAQSQTRTGYAHTDEISLPNLEEAARSARAIADRAAASGSVAVAPGRPSRDLYALDVPPIAADLTAKLDLLRRVDAEARAADPRVPRVTAALASQEGILYIATPAGWAAGAVRPLNPLNATGRAEAGGQPRP